MKKAEKSYVQQVVLLLLLCLAVVILLFSFRERIRNNYANLAPSDEKAYKTHTSIDLQIAFDYPLVWSVDEKARDIVVASYPIEIGQNSVPQKGNIKIMIDEFFPCKEALDDAIRYGNCTHMQASPNEIIEKEVRELRSGTFTKYAVQFPTGEVQTLYYLQLKKTNHIFQITKTPQVSMYEKEYEAIVSSIRLL